MPSWVPWRAELAHLKACLLGSLGETEAALRVLEEASTLGSWWQETIARGLRALREELRGLPVIAAGFSAGDVQHSTGR
jgi:hypothetical protein